MKWMKQFKIMADITIAVEETRMEFQNALDECVWKLRKYMGHEMRSALLERLEVYMIRSVD